MSTELPQILTEVPGPRSVAQVDVLARRECPAITARRARRAATLGLSDTDPIVWETAEGAVVQDVDGNRYVDLTSGFGVALVGHRAPFVVEAAHTQIDRLLHAMGDAFPDVSRIALLDALIGITPGMQHAILGLSGSDAIDAMVKTALLATGRPGILVFEGAYHGLSLGAVPLQRYKAAFHTPFEAITHPHVRSLPWGALPDDLSDIGLVLAEPVQGRGGMRLPPEGWLHALRERAHAGGALFGVDEIQTGMGRTGTAWACPVQPDLMAVGKALAGGFPLSACLGTEQAMSAWGASRGEALHTQTFLGHPVGCAAATAVIRALPDTLRQVEEVSKLLKTGLRERGFEVQGRGLMLGVRHPEALRVCRELLAQGFIVLPAGAKAEVLALTPPAVLTPDQITAFLDAMAAA